MRMTINIITSVVALVVALAVAVNAPAGAQAVAGEQTAPPPVTPATTPSTPASTPASSPPTTGEGAPSITVKPFQTGAENKPAKDEITESLSRSVEHALVYLASTQNEDGSFGRGRYGRHVGIAALCGLAFMADGNLPSRGRYGEHVSRTLDYVLSNTSESGLLAAESTTGPMYGHGFATLFLGEVYGMNPDDSRVRDVLVRAIDLILNSQNDEGGWRYNPVPYDADVSVTICEVMALRSARNAGIKIPKETIDRAVRYVRDCQNADGGFRYMRQPGTSAWPRTAAGVASLFYAGVYEDDSIERGLEYLLANAGAAGAGPQLQAHYFYGQYYATQTMYLAGGARWDEWWSRVREELIAMQTDDGSWVDHQAGNAYATAMALIVLQMPNRYLPIFQR